MEGKVELQAKQKTKRQLIMEKYRNELGVGIAFILFFVVICIISPYFFTSRNLSNLASQCATIAILAIGETYVVLTGGIDLSVGSVMGFSSMVAAMVMVSTQSVALGVIIGLIAGMVCGVVNGLLVGYAKLPGFIVTLGMMQIARNVDYLMCGGVGVTGLPESIKSFAKAKLFEGVYWYYIVIVVLFIIAGWMLRNTKLGRYTYAIGSNEKSTRLSGVNVKLFTALPYFIAGLMAGIGGIVLASRFGAVDPNYGDGSEMDAIAAVVIGGASLAGGKGSMIGTVIGVLLMATIKNGLDLLGVSPYWQGVTVGIVIIGVLLIGKASELLKKKV